MLSAIPNSLPRRIRQATSLGSWREGVLRHAAVLASGHGVAIVFGLATYPFLCRIYTPAAFGVLAIFNMITMLVIVVGTLRFENALPLPRSSTAATALATIALLATFTLSLVLLLAACGWFFFFGGDTFTFAGGNALALLAAGVMTVACFQIVGGWSVRNAHFTILSQMRIAHIGAALLVQFCFPLLFFPGAMGLIVGQIVGFGVAALWGACSARDSLRLIARMRTRYLSHVINKYRKYPALDTPASLLSSVTNHGPPAITALFYGTAAAGCFSLAYRLLAAPLTMLGTSVSRAYYNRAVAAIKEHPGELPKLFRQTVRQMLLLTLLPVTVVAALAPSTFATIFGEEWRQSGYFITLLAPVVTSSLVVLAISPTFDVLKRLDLRLLREASSAVLILVGMVIPWSLGRPVHSAVAVASLMATCGQVLALFLAWRAVEQSANDSPQLREEVPAAKAA